MNYDTLKPDALALQTTVIDWLKSVNNFNNTVSEALGEESNINETKEFYKEFQQQIDRERRNVEQMELVMVIAAPMNAGKSTIINALVGMDMLPHRAAAMTTLPTEVVFGEEKEPILTLSDDTLSAFQDIWSDLRSKISDEPKIAEAQKKIQQYAPHVEKLLKEIQQSEGLPISKETGCNNLINALATLNDIVRLYNLIEEFPNRLSRISSVPRIETSFWRLSKTENLEDGIKLPIKGKLVIVDTPGPNDPGQGVVNVLKEQLQKSSMVLLVLNFADLITKTAEDIKKDVKDVIDHIGYENLYILVNKIDQRDESTDMNPKRLIQFVEDLRLFESSNRITNRVFECSAKRAFSAAKFIHELQQSQTVSLSQMRTEKAFYQEMLAEMGRDSQKIEQIQNFLNTYKLAKDSEKLDPENKQQLQNFAEILWNSSGFKSFFDEAIAELIKTTTPKVIKNATKNTQDNLEKLQNGFQIRSTAAEKSVNEIQNAIGLIENRLSNIKKSESDISQVLESTIETLHSGINKKFQIMLSQAKKEIQQHLNERFNQNFLRDVHFQSSSREFPYSEDKNKFNNEKEAEIFFNEVYAEEKKFFAQLLFSLRDSIGSIIETQVDQLLNSIEENIQPILENAWNELKENFGQNLMFTSLPIRSMMDDVKISSKNYIILEEETVSEEITVKRRTWWHWFFLVPVEVKKTVLRIDGIYVVQKKDISELIMTEINQNTMRINTKVNESISDYLKQKIIVIFQKLNNSLLFQKNSLRQAIEDNQKSGSEKKELVDKLTLFKISTSQEIERAKKYQEYAKELIRVE